MYFPFCGCKGRKVRGEIYRGIRIPFVCGVARLQLGWGEGRIGRSERKAALKSLEGDWQAADTVWQRRFHRQYFRLAAEFNACFFIYCM
jgi:hypothetical protein